LQEIWPYLAFGKRLAKRDDATAISTLRRQGQSANDIRRSLGFTPLD